MNGFGSGADGLMGAPGTPRSIVDFPLPWLDYASSSIPNSLTLVLRWAEYLWMSHGTYRQACQRTSRYFITPLKFTDIDDDKAEDVRDILEHHLKYAGLCARAGDNYQTYGNVFLVRYNPFTRYLMCPCGEALAYNDEAVISKHVEWSGWQFIKGSKGCPGCGSKNNATPWKIWDSQSKDPKDLAVLEMNPHEIEIAHDPYSGAKEFYWNLPSYLTSAIQRGVSIVLRRVPEEIIEAAKTTKRIKFSDDMIFHAAEPAPAGFYTGGWGLPRVISNFRLAYHYQTLNRFDLAIAMDYINGMRVISPDQSTNANGAGDPLLSMGGSLFRSAVTSMVTTHRRDPASWQISGFPVKYQLFGGEGQQLSPKELLKMKSDEWLDASGVPAELYHGNLSVNAAPMALRVFENSWPEIIALYNGILEWITGYLVEVMDVAQFRVELMKPSVIDDIERRGLLMQLMAGNQISPQTALQSLGINTPRDEIRRGFDWQIMSAEEEKKYKERIQQLEDSDGVRQGMAQRSQAALSGQLPGGAPQGGGAPMDGAMPQDEEDMDPQGVVAKADQIAQQLQTADPATRRRTLSSLKKTNPTLYAQVKAKDADYTQQAKSTGVSLARQGQIPSGGGQAA